MRKKIVALTLSFIGVAATFLPSCSNGPAEKYCLNIKDLNNIILNKDEICEPDESYGFYEAGEEITFAVKFFSGLAASLCIDGRDYQPISTEAWTPGYVIFTMPEHDVSVVSLINDCAGDDAKLCETLEWGGLITDEALDYIDIQEWFIGVAPESEYGETARMYNCDDAISGWFNRTLIREQKYDVEGGSGYVITFSLKDSSFYILSVSNDHICINGKHYHLVGGLPYFLKKTFMKGAMNASRLREGTLERK